MPTIKISLTSLSIFENNCSVKSVSVQNSFCSLQLLPKHVVQTNRNKVNCLKSSLFIFMCDYTYILILKRIVSSDQLIGVRYHLVVAFCIIIPYNLQDVMINVSKTENIESISTPFNVGSVLWRLFSTMEVVQYIRGYISTVGNSFSTVGG